MHAHQRLRAEPQENLKTIFILKKVLFANGATREYNAE
jgi:hypothetical protein